jgi:Carboxypeptidase regulatory-like domain/TonB-dependent Receptor Plug Domain
MKNQSAFLFNANTGTKLFLSLFCAIVLMLAVPFAAYAQDITAAVRGTVTDEQGAAIVGAEVTVTSPDTGFSRAATTGTDGVYNFPDLPLGAYKIRVTHAGFKAEEQTGIVLHVADSRVINFALKVGAVSEQVTVEANTIQVETTTGDLTGLIEGNQVTQLPLNGRNFMQLVTLVPGVSTGEGFSAQAKGLKGGSDISISGGAVNSNLWLVDGAHNNDVGSNRTILVFPSIDAIDEFKIERNSYSAQFGQSAGGQISIVTKGGSNEFHGDVYYFGRNDALNTFNTFAKDNCPATGCEKNKLRRNDFGYTIGGPVKKDKIFFFWSQEWNRQIEGDTTTARVPTIAEKGGNFSDIATACPATFGFPVANPKAQLNGVTVPRPAGILDPSTATANSWGTPFANNTIPTGNLSPAAQVILQAYPDPTNLDPCAANNFTKSFGVPTYWREESARGDINLTSTLRAMMRFTNDSWQLGPPDGGFGWGNNNLGPIGQSWSQPGRVVIGKLSKTIGSTMVNDFTFSYSANRITITPAGTNPGLDQKLNDTIPTFFPLSGKTYGDKGPAAWINCCGLPSVWTIAPWQNQQDLYTWQDDFSMVRGKHTIRFGGLYSRNYKAEQGANPEFGVVGGPVGFNGTKGISFSTGYGISDLELKNMAVGWSENQDLFKVRNVWHDVEGYITDNWRITPRLTLDYGIRWSFLPPPYLSDDQYTLFNPSAVDPALGNASCNGLVYSSGLASNPCPAGLGGVKGPNRALMNSNNHLIAPRLGIAWDPTGTGRWAVRAGVGQFFNRDRLWPLQLAGNNAPFNPAFSSTGGNGRFLDSTAQLPACAPNCFGTGLGTPSTGQEFSDHVPNSWQWNLSVQRELFKDAKLELAYVANKNLHWEAITDVNAVLPGNRLTYVQNENDPSCKTPPQAGCRTAALSTGLRPFGEVVADNSIKYYTHASSSDYQSLQALYNMRIQNRLTFQTAYTYSKLLANSQRIDSPPFNYDANNLRSSWGPDILNHPHIFSANLVYDLPALQGSNSFVRAALGSWQASTIVSLASGPSISTLMSGVQGLGDPGGVGNGAATNQDRPNRVVGQPCRTSGMDSRQFINPNMFTVSGYQLGQIGNAGVGTCLGPGNKTVDFGVDKNFKITERIKAQFRFEFFNLFNHPSYSAQDVINNETIGFNSPVYGDASGNAAPLTSATQILSATPNPGSNFGRTQSIREQGFRQLQYALKFIF